MLNILIFGTMRKVIIAIAFMILSIGSYAQVLEGERAGVSLGYTNQNQVQFEIFAFNKMNIIGSFYTGVGINNKKDTDLKSTSMNIGAGYIFSTKMYAMGIVGFRTIPNLDPEANYGVELGWIGEKMKVGFQYTKEGEIGAKIGFILF